ncbi:hypothetical protein P7L78_19010 [Tistrella bauzanensis]|uniref:hypothetical protein n=1 Tax=Tistrella TaxID=171436 RepID=UPI0031F6F110
MRYRDARLGQVTAFPVRQKLHQQNSRVAAQIPQWPSNADLQRAPATIFHEIPQATHRPSGADAAMMEDDLREELHAEMAPCDPQVFVDAYIAAHKARFGEDFTAA